ncbi:MAG: hypothetical protein JWP37_550 [Mucilaginibacter sp.]|nr:hypothetical protein [Mucilaginibacter sp.]
MLAYFVGYLEIHSTLSGTYVGFVFLDSLKMQILWTCYNNV